MSVTLRISKFGQFLSSRPEGREAALAALAYYDGLRNSPVVELDFAGVLVLTPSWLSEFMQTLLAHGILGITSRPCENASVRKSVEAVRIDLRETTAHRRNGRRARKVVKK